MTAILLRIKPSFVLRRAQLDQSEGNSKWTPLFVIPESGWSHARSPNSVPRRLRRELVDRSLGQARFPGNMKSADASQDLPFIKWVNDGVKESDGCAEMARMHHFGSNVYVQAPLRSKWEERISETTRGSAVLIHPKFDLYVAFHLLEIYRADANVTSPRRGARH